MIRFKAFRIHKFFVKLPKTTFGRIETCAYWNCISKKPVARGLLSIHSDAPYLSEAESRVVTMKFYSFYSRLPHPQDVRFRVRMFRMHGPQWNNTRIILTDARYPAIDFLVVS